jgi:hypothetical protein
MHHAGHHPEFLDTRDSIEPMWLTRFDFVQMRGISVSRLDTLTGGECLDRYNHFNFIFPIKEQTTGRLKMTIALQRH